MKKCAGAVLATCLALGGAVTARAANYTLTCDAAKSGSITMVLTGFSLKVTNGSESAPSGMAAGRETQNFELTIRLSPGKEYAALISMVQDDEVLRSCKLLDTEGAGGTTAADNWTAESTKAKNKSKAGAQPASPSSGALEWIFSNASVTSVTAIGNESTAGAPEGKIEGTLKAQSFSFTM